MYVCMTHFRLRASDFLLLRRNWCFLFQRCTNPLSQCDFQTAAVMLQKSAPLLKLLSYSEVEGETLNVNCKSLTDAEKHLKEPRRCLEGVKIIFRTWAANRQILGFWEVWKFPLSWLLHWSCTQDMEMQLSPTMGVSNFQTLPFQKR